jgi:metal-dependent amidase/aminoacylase/carboxypeptidase family protein
MKNIIVFLLLSTFYTLSAQNQDLIDFCKKEANKLYPQSVNDLNELEKRAEIKYNTPKTAEYIIKKMKKLQKQFGKDAISFDTLYSGLKADIVLNGNTQNIKTLLIRAEIDGLTNSKGVNAHLCGHHFGVSNLLNLCELVLKNRGVQKSNFDRILAIFSASEEAPPSGLKKMCEKIDFRPYGDISALCQHLTPEIEPHNFEIRPNVAQASSQVLTIVMDASVKKGGHIQDERLFNCLEIWDTLKRKLDSVVLIDKVTEHLMRWTNVYTNKKPDDPFNGLPTHCYATGNFRTFDSLHQERALQRMDSIINLYAEKYKKDTILIYRAEEEATPVLINDASLTEKIKKLGSNFLGKEIKTHKLRRGSDDYSMLRKFGITKSVLIRNGVKAQGALHRDDFKISDTESLKSTLGLFAYFVYSLD